MRVVYRKCPDCGETILCNGPGSSNSIWNRRLTRLLWKIYPTTQELFFGPSIDHDVRYHRGSSRSLDREACRLAADGKFRDDCIASIEKSGRLDVILFAPWFYWQAEKYYIAIRLGGDEIWGTCSCVERKGLTEPNLVPYPA